MRLRCPALLRHAGRLLLAMALGTGTLGAASGPQTRLWRLDCGSFDTKRLTNSCYLIHHRGQWMLWDAGFGAELVGRSGTDPAGTRITLRESLVSQLAQLGVTPEQVGILALSHLHFDHIGQAASFPAARLLVGRPDWEAYNAEPDRLAPWTRNGAPKQLVDGDLDVFGDGTVLMLATPGHTPGHHALLVKLAGSAPVLLSGDLYYSTDQYQQKLVSKRSADAAAMVASFARFDALAASLHATVVIQHEPGDIAKLPAFPSAAQ